MMGLAILAGILGVTALIFVYWRFKDNPSLKNILRKIWDKVFFSSFIRYVLEAYLTLVMTVYIASLEQQWGTWDDTKAATERSFLLFVYWMIPFFIWLFLHKNLNELHKPKFAIRYSSLYLKINILSDWGVCYNAIFCLRRAILCHIIVNFQNYAAGQVMSILYMATFTIIYTGYI